jgi:hypothetical protein
MVTWTLCLCLLLFPVSNDKFRFGAVCTKVFVSSHDL